MDIICPILTKKYSVYENINGAQLSGIIHWFQYAKKGRQHEEIRKKESDARDAYIKEKRKHQTVIDLQR